MRKKTAKDIKGKEYFCPIFRDVCKDGIVEHAIPTRGYSYFGCWSTINLSALSLCRFWGDGECLVKSFLELAIEKLWWWQKEKE